MTPPVFLLKEVETAFIAHLFLLPLRKVPHHEERGGRAGVVAKPGFL